jgi:Ser/Thr protein kinase RdoA (MazF antagonist)
MSRDITAVLARRDCTVIEQLDSQSDHTVYQVRVDGARAICKVDGGDGDDVAQDAALLAFIGEETPVPALRVRGSGADHYLASWVAGTTYDGAAPRALRERRLRNAGATLARLHAAVELDAHGRFVPGGDGPRPVADLPFDAVGRWDEMLLDVVEGWREDLPSRVAQLGDAVAETLRTHREAFAGRPATLVHGDYAGHNLLFDGAAVAAVLDWEMAFAGAGEFDRWRAEQALFEGAPPVEPDDDLRTEFRAGYESVRPADAGSAARGAAYRAVLALSPLAHIDAWPESVDREQWLDHYETFVPEQLAAARAGLEGSE